MANGKKTDVLIEDHSYIHPVTGETFLSDHVTVYADPGMEEIIRKVEGVVNVLDIFATQYYVHLDVRYDREYVKQEIIAAIKTADFPKLENL